MAGFIRPRVIRDAWIAAFGDDPSRGKLTAPHQHRVLCPFHAEREPSCDVHLEKNTFLCRSCGAAGGVLDAIVREGYAETRSAAISWLQARGVRVC